MEIGDLLADAGGLVSGRFNHLSSNTSNSAQSSAYNSPSLKLEDPTMDIHHAMHMDQEEDDSLADVHRSTGGKRPFTSPTAAAAAPAPSAKRSTNKNKKKPIAPTPKEPVTAIPAQLRNLSIHEKRRLETEAYCAVLSAFRSQGELTWKKDEILVELRSILKVSEDRHRLELKRIEDLAPNKGSK